MNGYIPFARPDITEEEIAGVVAALRSGWITTGPRVKEFEADFAQVVAARHAVAVNSCTAAMHLALEALGVGPADEVIVPTMTFAATGEVVRYLGARPVMVDIVPEDHSLDPEAVERAATPRTKAVLAVHFAGQPCDMETLVALCRDRGLRLVEDAAHSFPASYRGQPVGSLGDITCFSFYATKPLTTGEGGMVTTDDEQWAERVRIMSLHGISKDAWKRYTAEGTWRYDILAPGFKYNLTDTAAALGLGQLRRAEEMRDRRRRIATLYREAFASTDAIELLSLRPDTTHAWHLFVIKLVPAALSIDRDQFVEELRERGIGTSVHFIPLHLHSYYRDTYGYLPTDFPVALDAFRRSISLPIYSLLSDDEATRVADTVLDLASRYRR